MQIGQEILMTERAQVEELSFSEKGWFLGQAKSRIVHFNPQHKLNMLQQQ